MLSYLAFQIKSGDIFFFLKRTAMQGQFLLNKCQDMEKKKLFSVLVGSVMKRDNLKLQPCKELYWPVTIMSRSHRQTNSGICSPSQLSYNFEITKYEIPTLVIWTVRNRQSKLPYLLLLQFSYYKLLN